MTRYLRGSEMWRWRHVAKTQKRGTDALRRMMHLGPLPTSVRTDLPVVRRAIEASRASRRNAGRPTGGQSGQQANETSSGGENA